MKLVNGFLGVGLALSGIAAWGQPAATEPVAPVTAFTPPRVPACPKASLDSVRAFYLKNVSQPNDGNEIQTAIRNLLPPDTKIYYVPSQAVLLVCGTPDLFALAQKMIDDLDRPKHIYRLTYTITETDGGKRVSAQHFSLMPEDGQRVTLKQGSKFPLVTGSVGASGTAPQTQVQYLDVGMNFDATLTGIDGGGVLKTKVEQSSIAEEKSGIGPEDPVVRQTSIEGTSVLTTGKPLMLGSIDIPGSTRHLDVEVMMELVK